MSGSIFNEGGPHHTRRIGPDRYEMHIRIPPDEDGFVGRQCPDETCSPGYYKIKLGTGLTGQQSEAYCPYCRHSDEPNSFFTEAQKDYATRILRNETINAVHQAISKGLGVGPSGKRKFGSGMFSMELSYKASPPRSVGRPIEEELRRDITCPSCGLEHAVFGLATWCPDCGTDIFLTHVKAELDVVRKILGAVENRRSQLGARVAARDIENSLEDVVSVFEAVLKVITRRHLQTIGLSTQEINERMRKIVKNTYQNVGSSSNTFKEQIGAELYDELEAGDVEYLDAVFKKRHPIAHNLGVVDRTYLERALSDEIEGREIRVTEDEVTKALELSFAVLGAAYKRL